MDQIGERVGSASPTSSSPGDDRGDGTATKIKTSSTNFVSKSSSSSRGPYVSLPSGLERAPLSGAQHCRRVPLGVVGRVTLEANRPLTPGTRTPPDGASSPHVWRKVLYCPQPFPDTHTDPATFLADMRTNAGVLAPRYWPMVRDSCGVSMQILLVCAVVSAYLFLSSHRISSHLLLLLDAASLLTAALLSTLASLSLEVRSRKEKLMHAEEQRLSENHVHSEEQRLTSTQSQGRSVPLHPNPIPMQKEACSSNKIPCTLSVPLSLPALLSSSRLPRLFIDCCLFVCGLHLLAPVLHTLTRSIATDTVTSSTVTLLLVHLFFHDYHYAAPTFPPHSVPTNPSSFSGNSTSFSAPPPSFSGNLSLLSSIFASVLLASRLETSHQVFTFLWLAISTFGLLPALLNHVRRAAPLAHRLLIGSLMGLSVVVIVFWSVVAVVAVLAACVLVSFVFPLLFVKMHKEKLFIRGPWDEALPIMCST